MVSFGSQRMLHPISSLLTVCQSCGGVNAHVLPDGFLIFGANIVNVRLFALTYPISEQSQTIGRRSYSPLPIYLSPKTVSTQRVELVEV